MNTLYNRRNVIALIIAFVALVWLAAVGGRGNVRYAVPEVDLPQARALIDSGAMVIDVRSSELSGIRHLPGAVLIPLAVMRTGIPPSLATARDRQIVIYCNDGVKSGPEATHLLRQAGFKNAVSLKGGMEGWVNAGLPVVKG